MCLMGFTKHATTKMKKSHAVNGMLVNDDGWGIMYADPDTRRVVTNRGFDISSFKKAYYSLPRTPGGHAFHFRYATSGNKGIDMTHPFEVLNKDVHGIDLWMMHNGVLKATLYDDTNAKGMSDTALFIEQMLRPEIARDPHKTIYDPAFQKDLGNLIGNPNKFLFLDDAGNFITINEYQGVHETDGFWYSNTGYEDYGGSSYYDNLNWGRGYSNKLPKRTSAALSVVQNRNDEDWLVDKEEDDRDLSEIPMAFFEEIASNLNYQTLEGLDRGDIELLCREFPDQMAEFLYHDVLGKLKTGI